MDQLKKPKIKSQFQITLDTLSKNLEQLLTLLFAINLFSNMKPSDSVAQIIPLVTPTPARKRKPTLLSLSMINIISKNFKETS